MGLLSTTVNSLLNLVFPSYCVSCGVRGSDLCTRCLMDCGDAERECAEWIYPLFDYRHPSLKRAIHLLKYKGRKKLADVMAEALYGRILEELADLKIIENFNDPVLIPIPLSGKRRRERGFNQAELICKALIEIDGGKNFILEKNVLVRPKDTVHQAHIENRSERLKNIIGSFSVKHEERIKNRNIILIDDVTTTGATLTEAKKILKLSGAKKIIAFTIAH